MNIWIGRKETKTIVHSDHAFATVAYLEVKDAVLDDKPEQDLLSPTIPPMLDDLALQVQEACSGLSDEYSSSEPTSTVGILTAAKPNIRIVGSWAYVSNVQHTLSSTDAIISIEDEMNGCFKIIKGTQ